MSVSHSRFGASAVKSRLTPVVVDRWAGLRVLAAAPSLAEDAPPAVVAADTPGGPLGHRLTGRPGFVEEEAVAELRVVAARVEQGVGPVCLGRLGVGDRRGQPPVVGLAGQPEHPARHRHRHPVRGIGGGQLADEQVHHFAGRFACDRYAAALRRSAASTPPKASNTTTPASSSAPTSPGPTAAGRPTPNTAATKTSATSPPTNTSPTPSTPTASSSLAAPTPPTSTPPTPTPSASSRASSLHNHQPTSHRYEEAPRREAAAKPGDRSTGSSQEPRPQGATRTPGDHATGLSSPQLEQ